MLVKPVLDDKQHEYCVPIPECAMTRGMDGQEGALGVP